MLLWRRPGCYWLVKDLRRAVQEAGDHEFTTRVENALRDGPLAGAGLDVFDLKTAIVRNHRRVTVVERQRIRLDSFQRDLNALCPRGCDPSG